jgi:hypothetical protein
VKAAIRRILLANSGVAALVGDRIAWGVLPRGTVYPAISLHLISAPHHYAMSGPSNVATSRVQVNCMADLPVDSDALASAVRGALSGIRVTIQGVTIQGAFLDNEDDLLDGEPHPPDEVHCDVRQDYLIWHAEADVPDTLGSGSGNVLGAG